MRLTRLIYECVRDSISIPGNTLDCDDFIASFSEKQKAKDLAMQTSVVFTALNEALSRLYEAGKVEPFVSWHGISKDGTIDLDVRDIATDEKLDIDVLNVFQWDGNGYENLEFRSEGGKIRLMVSDWEANLLSKQFAQFGVEYKKRFPHWDYDCLLTDTTVENVKDRAKLATAYKTELSDEYHVSNVAIDYIKEYVKSVVMEPMAPDVAIVHYQRAEGYLQSMKSYGPGYKQNRVRDVFKGIF